MLCSRWFRYGAASALLLIVFESSSPAAVIFSDNFDRGGPKLDDIDASTTGVTAAFSLPSTLYVERDEVLAPGTPTQNAEITHIAGDKLHLAFGPYASALHINHNFVGPGFVGMKVGIDILSNDGMADGFDRWVGLGFGGTLAEASAADYDFGATAMAPSWKGHQNGTTSNSGFADFFVAWERRNTPALADQEGRLAIWKNGVRTQFFNPTTPVLTTGGKLEVELAFDDFNAGSTVMAKVFYNGTQVMTDSFLWDNTNANYIGISARQDLAGWTVDNLLIEATTIPEPSSMILLTLLASAGIVAARRVRANS